MPDFYFIYKVGLSHVNTLFESTSWTVQGCREMLQGATTLMSSSDIMSLQRTVLMHQVSDNECCHSNYIELELTIFGHEVGS